MKSNKKSLAFIAIFAIPPLCIALFFVWLLILFCIGAASENSHRKFTENCYYSNDEELNQICSSFKEMYSDGLRQAELKGDTGELELSYRTEERGLYSETIDFSDTYCTDILNNLRQQYQPQSDYPVFSAIRAFYDDNGDMLLFVQAKKRALKKKSNDMESPDIRCYYLVYIDEGYSGHGSSLGIDNFEITSVPFADNWHTWSKDLYLG